MKKKIEWKWERLDDNTCRAKVIGGWILVCGRIDENDNMVFIPDSEHYWIIPEKVASIASKNSALADDYDEVS